MDEFDKIRELSEDIVNRREPRFHEPLPEADADAPADSDDAGLYRFSPVSEASESDDALGEEHFSSMKFHFLGIGIFIGILIVVLGGFFFFGNELNTSDEVMVIAATSEPVKVRPEQPGGLVIPDQDKVIYDKMRKAEPPAKVEKLFPEPEKPVLPIQKLEEKTPEKPFVPVNEIEARDPFKEASAAESPRKEIIALPKKPAAAAPAKPAAPPAARVPQPAAAAPVWHAQVLSSSNKASVEKAWPQILAKNKALLSNMSYQIVPVEIAGKGTFYRLYVGQFPSRDMANALCGKLKANKQDCVPAK